MGKTIRGKGIELTKQDVPYTKQTQRRRQGRRRDHKRLVQYTTCTKATQAVRPPECRGYAPPHKKALPHHTCTKATHAVRP